MSFEAAMTQLGGRAIFYHQTIHLGRGEPVSDTSKVISSMVDVVMIRTFGQAVVNEFAAFICACNQRTHRRVSPLSAVGGSSSLYEHRGDIEGRSVAWIGDGNNVCNTFIEAAAMLNFELRVACPRGLEPMDSLLKANVDRVRVGQDPVEAVTGADLVVTDVWASVESPRAGFVSSGLRLIRSMLN